MPIPIRPVLFPSFSPGLLDELTVLVEHAGGGAPADRPRLEADLLTVLYETGAAHDGDPVSEMWHAAADAPPDHKALTAAFEELAEAPNPLDPLACPRELRAELGRQVRMLRTSWRRREGRGEDKASPDALAWDALEAKEREEVRAMIRQLAIRRRAQVQAKRPRRNDLDTLLIELALVFVDHCRLETSHHDLPHAVNSYFIRFAGAALAPFYHPNEIMPGGLAHRWRRIQSAGIDPTENAPKPPVKHRKRVLRKPL